MSNDNLRLFPVSQLTFIHLLVYSTSFARFLLLFLLLLCSRPAANTRQAAAAATEAQTSCKRTIKKKNSAKWNWKWRQKLPNINDILPFDGILQSTHTIMIIMMRKGERKRKEVGKVKIFGRWRRTRSSVLSSIKIIKEPSELGDLAAMRSVTLRNGDAELDKEKWREEWMKRKSQQLVAKTYTDNAVEGVVGIADDDRVEREVSSRGGGAEQSKRRNWRRL